MAITIDWASRIISIPRNDMTLVQSSPTEIRELDTDWFRLQLKALESGEGIVYPDTHRHVAGVSVGGVTLARVIEIINDYTITFEDGQYAVNITKSNNNIGDRVNVNQVSVRSANSAGLMQTEEIEHASYNGGVTIDVIDGVAGTQYPNGTTRQPVNNLADALFIAQYRGFNTFFILGDLNITSGDYTGMVFIGASPSKTLINIDPAANVFQCEFYEAHVDGTLDGQSEVRNCVLDDLQYVSGYVFQCMLNPGTIHLGGNVDAHFLDCYSGQPGSGSPVIDLGGSGQALGVRNYNGGITLTNKTGPEAVSVDLASGQVKIDLTTVTNGEIVVRGDGKVIDAATGNWLPSGTYGSMTLVNETSYGVMLQEVWDAITSGSIPGGGGTDCPIFIDG